MNQTPDTIATVRTLRTLNTINALDYPTGQRSGKAFATPAARFALVGY